MQSINDRPIRGKRAQRDVLGEGEAPTRTVAPCSARRRRSSARCAFSARSRSAVNIACSASICASVRVNGAGASSGRRCIAFVPFRARFEQTKPRNSKRSLVPHAIRRKMLSTVRSRQVYGFLVLTVIPGPSSSNLPLSQKYSFFLGTASFGVGYYLKERQDDSVVDAVKSPALARSLAIEERLKMCAFFFAHH